jgi:hypothetical protein
MFGGKTAVIEFKARNRDLTCKHYLQSLGYAETEIICFWGIEWGQNGDIMTRNGLR